MELKFELIITILILIISNNLNKKEEKKWGERKVRDSLFWVKRCPLFG
jgi:hypothetical protein